MQWRLGALAVLAAIAVATGCAAAEQRHPFHQSESDSEARHRLAKKDYEGALSEANHALKENPRDPLALTTRGEVYFELGDYKHAIEDHDAVLSIAGDDPAALVNACWDRVVAKVELDRAKTLCDGAVAHRGSFGDHIYRGALFLRLGDNESALADFEAGLKLSKQASGLYGRGLAKMRLGRAEDGRADIVAALKQQPDIESFYSRWGFEP